MNANIMFGILSIATFFVTVATFPQNTLITIDAIEKAKELRMDLALSSWYGGVERCQSAGLQLASLRNNEEFSFVRQLINNSDRLWVAGILKGWRGQPWEAYTWIDGTDVTTGINLTPTGGQELCLYLSGDDHTYIDNCNRGQYGVLCQLTLT